MRHISTHFSHASDAEGVQNRYGITFVGDSIDQQISIYRMVDTDQDLLCLNGSEVVSVRQVLKRLYRQYQLAHHDDLLVESQFITLTRLLAKRSSQLTILVEQAHLLSWSVIALFLKLTSYKSNEGLIQIVMSGSPAIRAKCQILSEKLI